MLQQKQELVGAQWGALSGGGVGGLCQALLQLAVHHRIRLLVSQVQARGLPLGSLLDVDGLVGWQEQVEPIGLVLFSKDLGHRVLRREAVLLVQLGGILSQKLGVIEELGVHLGDVRQHLGLVLRVVVANPDSLKRHVAVGRLGQFGVGRNRNRRQPGRRARRTRRGRCCQRQCRHRCRVWRCNWCCRHRWCGHRCRGLRRCGRSGPPRSRRLALQ
mmetsp:Transcript_96871/g.278189  ORF Transcript_96871/g.278189 Transcript_96871/m.278189 type:complete len:216 (-) Transcript_96871:101-748(-)